MVAVAVHTKQILLAGRWVDGEDSAFEKRSIADGSTMAVVQRANKDQMSAAITAAAAAFRHTRKMPVYQRHAMLMRVVQSLRDHADELTHLLAHEVGKPLAAARVEVARAAATFELAAEESRRMYGQVVPMDLGAGSEGRTGIALRQPLGVIGAITPFNFPLNLVAHKVAPALAAGNTVVLRPTSEAPLIALRLGEILVDAGFVDGMISVLPCTTDVANVLIQSEKVAMISFTGSGPVGKQIRAIAGIKRVTLELGGNAANIVCASADIAAAATAIVRGGFAFAGQSCISAQRIYVHESVIARFLSIFVPQVAALKVGNPLDDGIDVGPMINEKSAATVEEWIHEAVASGAQVLAGGTRSGALLQPTVVLGAPESCRIMAEEAFAPLVSVVSFGDFDAMIETVNQSRYGLNYAIFTSNLREAWTAIEDLETGGVIVNDASAYRMDHMPYGGVKESGAGREGVRYAMEEMSELKFAVMRV